MPLLTPPPEYLSFGVGGGGLFVIRILAFCSLSLCVHSSAEKNGRSLRIVCVSLTVSPNVCVCVLLLLLGASVLFAECRVSHSERERLLIWMEPQCAVVVVVVRATSTTATLRCNNCWWDSQLSWPLILIENECSHRLFAFALLCSHSFTHSGAPFVCSSK